MNPLADKGYLTTSVDNETTPHLYFVSRQRRQSGQHEHENACTTCHDKSLGHRLFGDIHTSLFGEEAEIKGAKSHAQTCSPSPRFRR
jgi:hypothetical protein